MRTLDALSAEAATSLAGLVFDLDDTLLDHGALGEQAYRALFRLRESGLRLIACTGRPAGWAEIVARQWPVDAAVAENGAISFVREGGRVRRLDTCDPEERERRRARLSAIAEAIVRLHPPLALADDNAARLSDVTFDIGEHTTIPTDVVASARAEAEGRGARTFVSSVHMHATFDAFDKASGTIALLGRDGVDPTRARRLYAFVGDSENDAAAFAAFAVTFGVANVRPRARRISLPPKLVSSAERGMGFAEIAARLVELRRTSASSSR